MTGNPLAPQAPVVRQVDPQLHEPVYPSIGAAAAAAAPSSSSAGGGSMPAAPSTAALDSEPRLPGSDGGLLAVSSTNSLNAGGSTTSSTSGSRNKTLYLGNLHPFVTEVHLREVFTGLMGITELKVIKDKATGVSAGYGFAKFTDQSFAHVAFERVKSTILFGQEMRINWAFMKEQPEEVATLVHIFVGDLAPDVNDTVLQAAFSACSGCADARVQWDHATGRSRGYGFVSFGAMDDAEVAIAAMHGQFVGSRRIRCGWAQHKADVQLPMDHAILDRADPTNTNIYVGNLAAGMSDSEVRRHFASFGPLAEVKLHRKGGFGFVRYKLHEDAVRAIIGMNGAMLGGKHVKCSWGRHPNTPPSGMQASLMLVAAAGMGPLAIPQNNGGLLPTMGNFMGNNVMGMPMAGAGGAGIVQGQNMQLIGGGGGGGGGVQDLSGAMQLEPSLMYGGYAMPTSYPGNMFFPGQQPQ